MNHISRQIFVVPKVILFFGLLSLIFQLSGCHRDRIKSAIRATRSINITSKQLRELREKWAGRIASEDAENIDRHLSTINASVEKFILQGEAIQKENDPFTQENQAKIALVIGDVINSVSTFQNEVQNLEDLQARDQFVGLSAAYDRSISDIVRAVGCKRSGNCLICQPGNKITCWKGKKLQ